MKKGVSAIEFLKINEDDFKQFRLCSKRRLKFCLLFGGIFTPMPLTLVSEIAPKLNVSFFACAVLFEILYVFLALAPWWLYYAGKPKGIRYGRISAKNPERAGQYSGYSYNIYFKDIHSSLMRIWISDMLPGNHYKQIKLKDSIKVVKCWSGLIITMR